MSILDRALIYDEAVQGLGDDRVGVCARLAYFSALAASHVTYSDGTLPFGDSTLRLQLLAGIGVTAEEVGEIRRRLCDGGLVVPYVVSQMPYALLPRWWRHNVRPEKARRAAKSPPVPDDILATVPDFAKMYCEIPAAGEKGREKTGKRNRRREKAGTNGHSDPDPESDPEAVTVPVAEPARDAVPGSASEQPPPKPGATHRAPAASTRPTSPKQLSSPMDVIRLFEAAYLDRYGEAYCTTPAEQTKLNRVWDALPRAQRARLADNIADYVPRNFDATLGGFVESIEGPSKS